MLYYIIGTLLHGCGVVLLLGFRRLKLQYHEMSSTWLSEAEVCAFLCLWQSTLLRKVRAEVSNFFDKLNCVYSYKMTPFLGVVFYKFFMGGAY